MLGTVLERFGAVDAKVITLADQLRNKLGADGIESMISIASQSGLHSKAADDAFESALQKHAKAMLAVAPNVTAESISTESLIIALTSSLSKNEGAKRGI